MFPNSAPSLKEAKRLQLLLSERVVRRDLLPDPITHVAGVDVAYRGNYSFAAVAVHDYDSMKLEETRKSRHRTRFPYRSTFLSFRELPPAVSAIRKLRIHPDVTLVDGHGVAHPRRLGFASHLGLVLDAPTIGVAKSLLCGEVEDNGNEWWKPVVHRGETVGAAVSTRPNVKPVFVSIGHKVSLETATKIVLRCTERYRIPEPLRAAHMTARSLIASRCR